MRWALVTLAALAAACSSREAAPTQPYTYGMSAPAYAYLSNILEIMQSNSIKRATIDWTQFRTQVLTTASGAITIPQTYDAIEQAIGLLGDGHSSYVETSGVTLFVATRSCTVASIPDAAVPPGIGYVRVGGFSGTAVQATAFADSIQARIRAADQPGLSGWVVDLRDNTGGNMWPMVAGLGPILGDGVLGYFIDPTGNKTDWEFHDGASWQGGALAQRVDLPYQLLHLHPRVAVLVDNGVASSGEATFIAFRQRLDSRSFGRATCGLSTANRTFALSDGATLYLTTSVMADRAGTSYGDTIAPDEVFTDQSQAVQRAIAWLQGAAR